MKRLAQYNEERLRDKGASFGWWLKAHAEDHESEEIHQQIERPAGETRGWNQLVDAYAASLPKFAYFPFGGGPRRCLGMTLALHEMRIVLGTLVPRFELEPTRTDLRPARRTVTLAPAGGVMMRVKRVRS